VRHNSSDRVLSLSLSVSATTKSYLTEAAEERGLSFGMTMMSVMLISKAPSRLWPSRHLGPILENDRLKGRTRISEQPFSVG
jgi:hypothetical protein